MHLCIYSYFVPLMQHHAGGAQLFLHGLIKGIVTRGHQVTVICPRTEDSDLLSMPNLTVKSVLYEAVGRVLSIHERILNLQLLAEAVHDCDVVASIDRAFPLDIPQPTILMLQTIAYSNVIDSLLTLSWDGLIVSSNYLAKIVDVILPKQCWDDVPPLMVGIPNGIDTSHFTPTDPSILYKKLGIHQNTRPLLFPHRTEAAKGFDTALAVIKHLAFNYDDNYILLVPSPPRSNKASRGPEAAYAKLLYKRIINDKIDNIVRIHEWIQFDELPAYYSLGELCLTISILPEGFGFTPVQSISSGTRVISTRCGSLGDLFPIQGYGVRYVEPCSSSDVIDSVINPPETREVLQGRTFINHHYSLDACVENYINVFENITKRKSRFIPFLSEYSVRLSPWCKIYPDGRVWHDFAMRYYILRADEKIIIEKIMQHDRFIIEMSENKILSSLYKRGIVVRSWR